MDPSWNPDPSWTTCQFLASFNAQVRQLLAHPPPPQPPQPPAQSAPPQSPAQPPTQPPPPQAPQPSPSDAPSQPLRTPKEAAEPSADAPPAHETQGEDPPPEAPVEPQDGEEERALPAEGPGNQQPPSPNSRPPPDLPSQSALVVPKEEAAEEAVEPSGDAPPIEETQGRAGQPPEATVGRTGEEVAQATEVPGTHQPTDSSPRPPPVKPPQPTAAPKVEVAEDAGSPSGIAPPAEEAQPPEAPAAPMEEVTEDPGTRQPSSPSPRPPQPRQTSHTTSLPKEKVREDTAQPQVPMPQEEPSEDPPVEALSSPGDQAEEAGDGRPAEDAEVPERPPAETQPSEGTDGDDPDTAAEDSGTLPAPPTVIQNTEARPMESPEPVSQQVYETPTPEESAAAPSKAQAAVADLPAAEVPPEDEGESGQMRPQLGPAGEASADAAELVGAGEVGGAGGVGVGRAGVEGAEPEAEEAEGLVIEEVAPGEAMGGDGSLPPPETQLRLRSQTTEAKEALRRRQVQRLKDQDAFPRQFQGAAAEALATLWAKHRAGFPGETWPAAPTAYTLEEDVRGDRCFIGCYLGDRLVRAWLPAQVFLPLGSHNTNGDGSPTGSQGSGESEPAQPRGTAQPKGQTEEERREEAELALLQEFNDRLVFNLKTRERKRSQLSARSARSQRKKRGTQDNINIFGLIGRGSTFVIAQLKGNLQTAVSIVSAIKKRVGTMMSAARLERAVVLTQQMVAPILEELKEAKGKGLLTATSSDGVVGRAEWALYIVGRLSAAAAKVSDNKGLLKAVPLTGMTEAEVGELFGIVTELESLGDSDEPLSKRSRL